MQLYGAGHVQPLNDVCPNQGLGMKLLILVTTAPAHAKQREAVRGTWGHVVLRRDVALAFVVGISSNPSDNQAVQAENQLYGDIIQVSYRVLNMRDTDKGLSVFLRNEERVSIMHCHRKRV